MSARFAYGWLAVLLGFCIAGCDLGPAAARKKFVEQQGKAIKEAMREAEKEKQAQPKAKPQNTKTATDNQDTELAPGEPERKAVDAVIGEIKASAGYGKTLAVFLVDQTTTVEFLREACLKQLKAVAPQLFALNNGIKDPAEAPLLVAVVGFGKEVNFVTPEPVSDPQAFTSALDSLSLDGSGSEMTFTAISEAAKKYLAAKGRHAIFAVITDEAGDDANQLESTLGALRRDRVPVYVIGNPAPFGVDAGLPAYAESGFDTTPGRVSVRQGPESRHLERISLGYIGSSGDSDLVDSGFGPFALSWLARETEGRFIIIRHPPDTGGLLSAMQSVRPSEIDLSVMRAYAPDYVSDAEYQRILQSSKAAQALHDAAKIPKVNVLAASTEEFEKKSEAEFVTKLTSAQQSAAIVEERINLMYDVLAAGEKERDKLPSPRWKAGYDLALGRIMCAKARNDGYNLMIAAMKQGKNFTNPGSTMWVISSGPKVTAGSAVEKMAEKGRKYMEGIIRDHKGTPWALLAERELQTPVGWEWSER